MNKLTLTISCIVLAMTLYIMVMCDGVEGTDQHHHNHHNHHNHHDTPLSRLNMMVDRLDSSIWDKKQRLKEENAGTHFITSHTDFDDDADDADDDVDEVTIIESAAGEGYLQETHTEDMDDYVNNAPWTRRTHNHNNNNNNNHNNNNRHHSSSSVGGSSSGGSGQPASPQNIIMDLQRNILRLATENLQRVKVEGKCEVPQQRCETIRSSKHTPDTFFQPRCALLHRCSEDSGCCLTDDQVCAPLQTNNVQMYFYTFGDMRAKIEVMTFVNHTRCSCQPRNNNIITNCKCPRYFSPTSVDGECSCECVIGKPKCRRYKKGRRYFSHVDFKCVSSGECGEPVCEYGPFLMRHRRCPKRRERERYTTTTATRK